MPDIHLIPVPCVDLVDAGDDLGRHLDDALAAARVRLRDDDVLVVASKVVALAEGAVVAVAPPSTDQDDQRRALARAVAHRVVADAPQALVVATHHGLVCANAGIDASNVRDGLLLLPEDPDRSARALRRHVRRHHGVAVAVVVTDTFGRPWRNAQVDVAIGAAGLDAVRDERGARDLHGRVLQVSQVAVADEVAAAADLVRTKAERVPFVVVRGMGPLPDADGEGAGVLVRDVHDDLFPAGGPTLWEHATRTASPGRAHLEDAVVDLPRRAHERDAAQVLERVLEVLGPTPAPGCHVDVDDGVLRVRGQDAVRMGMVLQAAHTVLTGHGWHTTIARAGSDGGVEVALVTPIRAAGSDGGT